MSDVKRYKIVLDSTTLSAKEAEDGEWCSYSDLAAIIAERDALRTKVKVLTRTAIAFDNLCTHYRVGKRPSEKLFKELEIARVALDLAKQEEADAANQSRERGGE